MNLAKVYGKVLTDNQLANLLSGKEVSFTVNEKKTTVLPDVEEKAFQGKTCYHWKTKKVCRFRHTLMALFIPIFNF